MDWVEESGGSTGKQSNGLCLSGLGYLATFRDPITKGRLVSVAVNEPGFRFMPSMSQASHRSATVGRGVVDDFLIPVSRFHRQRILTPGRKNS